MDKSIKTQNQRDFYPNTKFCVGYSVSEGLFKTLNTLKFILPLGIVMYFFGIFDSYVIKQFKGEELNLAVAAIVIYEIIMFVFLRKSKKIYFDFSEHYTEKKKKFVKNYVSSFYLVSVLAVIIYIAVTLFIDKYEIPFNITDFCGVLLFYFFMHCAKRNVK